MLTTTEDFQQLLGGCCYRNYLADPDEWTNLFKVAGDDGKGRWRAVFPTRVEESDEQALGDESTYSRLQRVYPLNRKYNVVQSSSARRRHFPQRPRHSRFAGDSAHVNNSVGGLGLHSGIHDAYARELVDTLHQIITKQADESLLDRYTRRRRTSNIESVQEQTIANKKRLEERDPAALQAKFDELRAIAEDPKKAQGILVTHLADRQRAQSAKHGLSRRRIVFRAPTILQTSEKFTIVDPIAGTNLSGCGHLLALPRNNRANNATS